MGSGFLAGLQGFTQGALTPTHINMRILHPGSEAPDYHVLTTIYYISLCHIPYNHHKGPLIIVETPIISSSMVYHSMACYTMLQSGVVYIV